MQIPAQGLPLVYRGAAVRPVPPLVVQGLAGAEDEDVEASGPGRNRRGIRCGPGLQ